MFERNFNENYIFVKTNLTKFILQNFIVTINEFNVWMFLHLSRNLFEQNLFDQINIESAFWKNWLKSFLFSSGIFVFNPGIQTKSEFFLNFNILSVFELAQTHFTKRRFLFCLILKQRISIPVQNQDGKN